MTLPATPSHPLPPAESFSAAALSQGPACWSGLVEVRFQDVDAAGIVYFPRLISYFHDAYVAVLAARGLPLHELLQTSPWIAPIRRAEADFLRPVRFGDRLHASLVRAQASQSSISLGWRLTSGGDGCSGAPAEVVHATGKTVHTFVDRSFRRADLPDEMRRAFADALAVNPS